MDAIQGRCHELMHRRRIFALDEVRRVAVPAEQLIQFLVTDPGQDAGVGDLVAVEVQDRQDHAIADRVQELVGVPTRRQRAGLRLAIADDAGDDQVRVVVGGAKRVGEGIAQLATLVNRPGVSGATWLGMPPGNEN